MLEKILELRAQSKSIAQIAQECGLTIGQVKYRLQKDRAKVESVSAENRQMSSLASRREENWQLPAFYGRDIVKVIDRKST
ncbi:DUF4912 domain-containing protein, partial [Mesorhizobium sp. M00.F.Ca.ET.186.01.1.1]